MIREACPSDFDAISALELQVFHLHAVARPDMIKPKDVPFDSAYYDDCLKDDNKKIFVYLEDDTLLGHCMVRRWDYHDHPVVRDMTILEIDDLCVDESARGKQVGRQLFHRAKEYAKEIGAAHLELTVWGFNEDARRFYEHLGMTERIRRMELTIG